MNTGALWKAADFQLRGAYSFVLYWHGYRWLHRRDPFYAPRAIREVSKLLTPRTRLFEWGTGRSTVWFAARVGEMIAIEHDLGWFERTSAELAASALYNVDYRLCVPSTPTSTYDGSPESTLSKPEFANYVSQIDEYPDGYFDVIAIDGRERVGCAQHAVPKVAPNGCIILDDTRRARYGPVFSLLADWRVQRFSFGRQDTTLFFRSADGENQIHTDGA